MWPFNRKKNSNNGVPAEIKKYYQAEQRERTGIAWLLGIGTLLVTLALAVLLFFGGRWAYRTVFDNDSGEETAQSNTENSAQQEADGQGESQPAPQPETEPAPRPTPEPQPTLPTATDGQPAPQPQANSNGDIPNTGPRETMLLFVVVSFVSGFSYYKFMAPSRRSNTAA